MSDATFLGFPFSRLELSARDLLEPVLARHPQPLSGYTFATLMAWNGFFQYQFAIWAGETALVSCLVPGDSHRQLLQPVGPISAELEARLLREAAALDRPLRIYGAGEAFVRDNPGLVGHFDVVEDPNCANYLYRTLDLAELPGSKYARKRNHLAQAARAYEWTTEAMSAANAAECLTLLEEIRREDPEPPSKSMSQDNCALEFTLRHFEELQQQGLAVRVNGRLVAFSIFEPITPTMMVTHFERALRSYKGLYQVVNRETARAIALQKFEVINREEDLGDPGLRKAKLSYYPLDFSRFYVLTFRG